MNNRYIVVTTTHDEHGKEVPVTWEFAVKEDAAIWAEENGTSVQTVRNH